MNKKFFIIFVSNRGPMYSSGYVAGPLSEDETAKELNRLEDGPQDGDVLTSYHIIREGDHECSVRSWQGACRQCRAEGGV